MKNRNIYLMLFTAFIFLAVSCSEEFLDQPPKGAYSGSSLANQKGVEGMLIATYAVLDGLWFESWGNNNFNQNGGASNWIWGGVRSEDAYKGTEPSDGVDINPIERFESLPSNPTYRNKWVGSYDGIGRANDALRVLATVEEITDAERNRIEGELKFLRGHFHFEARKTFGRPVYVDETVTGDDYKFVTNAADIWPNIEADFKAAMDLLPGTMPDPGRANKWAAASYLAKTYSYQGKWSEAKALYDQILSQGTTAAGVPYALEPIYSDNFNASVENGNTESIFAVESSVNDGSISNGNYENTLNMPHGSSARTACCGFYQPSQNLVNSFKTEGGLPLLDTYNDEDVKNDADVPAEDPFEPYTGELDPRLDWTVGRRGVPYLDWGPHPGRTYIRDVSNGGPYSPIKNVPRFADYDNGNAGLYDWGFTLSALNIHIMRLGDIVLLAAEAEAELGNLARATELVNMVRNRAANPDGFARFDDGTPGANYVISPYPTFGSQADALKAIRFERKLELGMEGQRFFDLARWHVLSKEGKTALPFDMGAHLNAYLSEEATKRQHLAGASFSERYVYAPIPESVITQSTVEGVESITQNEGW